MTNGLVSLVQAVIVAVFGVLQAFDVFTLTANQNGAVLALYGAVAVLVTYLNTTYGKPAEIRTAARASGLAVNKWSSQ